jgi:threonine/homoserine/homoserine lactone efflux protein
VLEALQRLAPAVLRHLIAYGELLCEEAGDALRQSRRRALGLAVTVTAGVMALSLACVWVIAASWDSPSRFTVIGVLCASFAVIALAGVAYARGASQAGRAVPFERLRAEWQADMRELALIDPSLGILPRASTPRSVHGD